MTFKPDQIVSYVHMHKPATIISGPWPSHGADRWLIRKADDTVTLARATELAAVKTRREIVAEAMYSGMGGAYTWDELVPSTRTLYLAGADKVLAALDAHAEATPAAPQALKAGDRIRVLHYRLEGANVRAGDVLTVKRVTGGTFRTDAPRSLSYREWAFPVRGEGTSWERA